jgi:zinc protease
VSANLRKRAITNCAARIACAVIALTLICAPMPAAGQAAQTTQAPQTRPMTQPPAAQSAPAQLVAQMPGATQSKPYHFPPVATKTLANGLRVFVVSSSEMPAVGVQLVLNSAGSVNDPAGKPGIAAMAATLLTQGTEKRTAEQIAEATDFVGGSISASTFDDRTEIDATAVKKDFDLVMDILSDVALHAKFDSDELERQRQQLLSNLRVNYDDADYLASAVFQRVVFGAHPYGLPGEGTPASVQAMKREDLIQFRDTYYSPGTALLAFSGDISPEAAFAAAEKYFGAWPSKQVGAPAHAPLANQSGVHIIVVNKADAVQTQIRVGRIGIRRNDPDFIPLSVANRIFGGSYNSRLNTEVRVKKGLTYDANSEFEPLAEGGSLFASTFTRTETTVDAVKLVTEQIAGMASGNIKPEELNFARDYMVGVYPIQTETPDQVAGRVLTAAEYGLPSDYNETYQSRIAAVTLAQANTVAAKYFQAGSLDIVLAGNAAQFRAALKKEFPGASYDEFSAADLDLLLPDLYRKPETVPPPTPETLAQGKALLSAATQAAGGIALSKIQSLEYSGDGTTASPQGDFQTQLKLNIAYPDHYRLDTSVPVPGAAAPFVLVLGFDGKAAWDSSPRGSENIPSDQNVEFIRRILITGGWGVYRAAAAQNIQAQALGQRDFQGQKDDAVVVTAGDIQVILYFDPATHLGAGARYPQDTPQGPVETTEVWSDYREVDGVKFPCHSVSYRNGQKFSETSVHEIKTNTNPNPSLFVKPQ